LYYGDIRVGTITILVRPYRAEWSPDWIKVKNPKHPAIQRVKEAFS
jgi:hypothetical protein